MLLYQAGQYATDQYTHIRREARTMIRKDFEENYRQMT